MQACQIAPVNQYISDYGVAHLRMEFGSFLWPSGLIIRHAWWWPIPYSMISFFTLWRAPKFSDHLHFFLYQGHQDAHIYNVHKFTQFEPSSLMHGYSFSSTYACFCLRTLPSHCGWEATPLNHLGASCASQRRAFSIASQLQMNV